LPLQFGTFVSQKFAYSFFQISKSILKIVNAEFLLNEKPGPLKAPLTVNIVRLLISEKVKAAWEEMSRKSGAEAAQNAEIQY
jgi:hypothetical protein